MNQVPAAPAKSQALPILPDTIGKEAPTKIPVELSAQFLKHFSEQLYSSPQKAFEELISNGWDAGADCVDIRIPDNLHDPAATLCVLDNGASMDEAGLRELWHIAFSPKTDKPQQHGRHVIGKFGIGKLATYVLAGKLTYICKAADGKIRRVTMDYNSIDQTGKKSGKLLSTLQLDLFDVSPEDLGEALKTVYGGPELLKLIESGVPKPQDALPIDEFGAEKSALQKPSSKAWTLVVLSELKPVGRQLKLGVLRRMLEAALPFGSEMAISINGEVLTSSKFDAPVSKEWIIGPQLGLTEFELEMAQPDGAGGQTTKEETIKIEAFDKPVPHVVIPQVGKITGQVKLFRDSIAVGKSEERGASNGFHVNVLGRVVNQNDPSFGEENLSHAAWARFRMTVRADGLNGLLTTDRERFRETRELQIFRGFLRKIFNKSRSQYDSDDDARMPDGGDVLVKSLGVVSLNPLRNIVSEVLSSTRALPKDMFDDSGIQNRAEKKESWQKNTADNIKSALGEVKYEKADDDSFVKFRISDNSIVVNNNHPFVVEHSRSKAEKELVRTFAMVNLLTDVYALDVGVETSALDNIRQYRDRLLRFRAMQQRRSGTYIARLLREMQNDSENSKRLEQVVSDALTYLGFSVRDLAKSGEPEGVASAFASPTLKTPTADKPNPPLYSFTFDAKSSKHEVAKTGNISLDAVNEHRKKYGADYALVVAPGYSDGALVNRCTDLGITPMTAHDLGRLLEYTVEYGALPLPKLRQIFSFHDPKKLAEWVFDLGKALKTQRILTIDIFLKALDHLKNVVPDSLSASTVVMACRQHLNAVAVKEDDVIALVKGLSILVPDLIGIEGDKIIINASSERVAAAVSSQLEALHETKTTASEKSK
ncbi:ATP-binding protein [Afipia clevelandensis]|jgi:hypothetical protein|uniref:Histidine kinase/HSP90-like ATPase domain-containing protein n=1 Tax=Afipia clevelandensis ATCC 49720 TaxID=883079 RepID=K8P3E4_9BRAD|nr:ATP-binding protein [Afipia clevelandensis]EGP06226.1 hypothetical protein CSIRO_4236 [Bradyrhizobiaceae bacterium SG-6C]EKS35991.1 hypothetical protein HMPREF9696_02203 [Afipia clevelandensis ATCC 49720]RTL78681.1 MAG: ATP-binding protein [Bradyrhizobiaceae bacterium]